MAPVTSAQPAVSGRGCAEGAQPLSWQPGVSRLQGHSLEILGSSGEVKGCKPHEGRVPGLSSLQNIPFLIQVQTEQEGVSGS